MRSYAFVATGEVHTAIVDDLVRTQGPHVVELGGVVDAGHVRTQSFRELNREGT